MRRYARSEGNRRIRRRIREEPEADEEGARAEIGSRVFPFRTPPPASPASMPTAGTRRSTRVFVKTGDAEPRRVLRSGRQVSAPKPESDWMKVFDSINGDGSWWNSGWTEPKTKKNLEEKKFCFVYSRKRRRSASSMESGSKDRRFGIVFSRKHPKKGQKPSLLAVEPKIEKDITLELAVLVESSSGHGSVFFARILLTILSWMRRVRVRVYNLAAFLSLGAIANIFAANGVHFIPVEDGKNGTLAGNSLNGCGLCKIYGAIKFTPLISLNFSAIPLLFNNFHFDRDFASFRVSSTLFREHIVSILGKVSSFVPYKECDFSVPLETGFTGTEFTVSETPAVENNGLSVVIAIPAFFQQSSVTVNGCGLKFRKHQKKRTSLRNSANRKSSRLNSRIRSFGSYLNTARASWVTKLDSCADPARVKLHDACLPKDTDFTVSSGSDSKQRSRVGKKSPIEKIKELRSALAEVRQNIDSACCNANILVTDTNKCWREEGAEIMMEKTDSQEWLIAVKKLGLTKYLYKPQDLKPCVVNRFTHAYMWSGDDSWKLEFCDKWDWYVFKELHMECQDRNSENVPIKVIPVPGVREVPDYEGDAVPSFLRPDIYIHTLNDEVGRALANKVARYDMDSADEDWLRQLKSSSSSTEEGEEVGFSCISEENFETIIFIFERDAYCCANDPFHKERALDLCQGLGRRDIISVVYEYWLKKRKQKSAALVRDFQGPPLRRARRKRSYKRQRSQDEHSQVGRGKPVFFWQADKEVQKVKEAEAAANDAAEVAIQLRTRAQKLVANADLAVYKSFMALRIAETIRASSSEYTRIESSILFD